MKRHISLLSARLTACLLCLALPMGCSASPAAPLGSAPPATSVVSEAENSGLHMTQAASVRKTTYDGQADFTDFLRMAQPAYLIPGLNEALVPQGMDLCEANGLLYLSGYYPSGNLSSSLVAVDAESGGFVAEYYLDEADGSPFTSHVGGVAVTDTTLYVSAAADADGGYRIAAIPLSDLPVEGSHRVTVRQYIPVPVSPSFLSYAQGYLWVGNFYHPGADYGLSAGVNYTTLSADGDAYGCYILGYDLSGGEDARLAVPEGGRYPLPDIVLAAPNKIQGMVLAADGTVTLSQSYGRKNNSALLRYRFDPSDSPDTTVVIAGQDVPAYLLDSTRACGTVTAMPMTEALADAPDGSILVLFESGASHYSNGSHRTDHVWRMRWVD